MELSNLFILAPKFIFSCFMNCVIKENGNSHLQYNLQKLSGHIVGSSEFFDLHIVSL